MIKKGLLTATVILVILMVLEGIIQLGLGVYGVIIAAVLIIAAFYLLLGIWEKPKEKDAGSGYCSH